MFIMYQYISISICYLSTISRYTPEVLLSGGMASAAAPRAVLRGQIYQALIDASASNDSEQMKAAIADGVALEVDSAECDGAVFARQLENALMRARERQQMVEAREREERRQRREREAMERKEQSGERKKAAVRHSSDCTHCHAG